MHENKFIKSVEKLINPITTGSLHFIQSFNEMLPKNIQKKLVVKASEKTPLMGFVVEPYCYFLCYEIEDKSFFQEQLPKGFELEKTKVFKDDTEKYYFILGAFNARTSAFFGNRVEAYVIAKNLETDLTSWVIIDYDTNTISYDSANGLSKPNCDTGVVTTTFNGEVVVDMQSNDKKHKLIFNSDIKGGNLKSLDEKLWIEGNLSVAYGKDLSTDGDVFSLRFNPKEMSEALDISLQSINIDENTWYSKHLKENPDKLVCFPYAQHFISDAPGYSSNLKNKEELIENINNIDFKDVKVYSTSSFKNTIMIMNTILAIIIIILLVIVIMK